MPSPSSSSSSREQSRQGAHRDSDLTFAPYMRSVALPDLTMTPPTTPHMPLSSIHGGSARSRQTSLPVLPSGPDRFVYGMAPPALSLASGRFPPMAIHALLRIDDQFASSAISYNTLYAPSLTGPRPLLAPSIPALTEYDLSQVAFQPAISTVRLGVLLFSHPQAAPAHFPWAVSATPSRRVSAPVSGQMTAMTVFDVLASLHLALMMPVSETELARFSPQQVEPAHAMRARRLQLFGSGMTPVTFVRADFLGNCTKFAGILRCPDNSLVFKLTA